MKETVTGLERERDFYFAKLRDIEMLIQTAIEADPEIEKDNDSILKQIQTILYSTEVSIATPEHLLRKTDPIYRKALRFHSKLKARSKRRHSRPGIKLYSDMKG